MAYHFKRGAARKQKTNLGRLESRLAIDWENNQFRQGETRDVVYDRFLEIAGNEGLSDIALSAGARYFAILREVTEDQAQASGFDTTSSYATALVRTELTSEAPDSPRLDPAQVNIGIKIGKRALFETGSFARAS